MWPLITSSDIILKTDLGLKSDLKTFFGGLGLCHDLSGLGLDLL